MRKPSMLSRQEMMDLIESIDVQLTAIYKERFYGAGVDRSILHSPADAKAIAAFERKTKIRFPPSYKQFLQLHNGWEHFWFDMTLTGVSGKHTQKFLDELHETIDWQLGVLTERLGQLTPRNVQAWEKKKRNHLYLPNHWCFGTSFAGEFFVFDQSTSRPDGEMEVVFWNIGSGADDDYRYKSFSDFLNGIATVVASEHRKLIKSQAKKKNK